MVSQPMTLQTMNGIYICPTVHNAVPRPQEKNQSLHTFKCPCPLLTQHRFYYTQEKQFPWNIRNHRLKYMLLRDHKAKNVYLIQKAFET